MPILDGAQEALEAVLTAAVDTRDEAPVFTTVERKRGVMRPTGRPLSPRMVTRVFRRYADQAGLPKAIRLHDLRHTAITNAISQGEDIMLVSAFAGHAKTSTTVDVYSHLLPKRAHEAARRMRSVAHAGDSAPVSTAGGVSQRRSNQDGMPSQALESLTTRLVDIDQLFIAHAAVAGSGPGKKGGVIALNRAGVLLLNAHFEGYLENVFEEALATFSPSLDGAQLYRWFSNPWPKEINKLFAFFGMKKPSDRPHWKGTSNKMVRDALEELVARRNQLAHGELNVKVKELK